MLDEIQMLAHPERGWAWSRALLGLPAESLHVCGSADALPLVRSLIDACGDELVVHEYTRLTPLVVEPNSLRGKLASVRPGDCVVAFSRREIFELKQRIEQKSGVACGVVYGSLPPETRRAQAALFNDPSSREEVLVASDAVGMGLNLNISRVVFASLAKFDGVQTRPLEPTEVKQIAGRAGRYASRFGDVGTVTCLEQRDHRQLTNALKATAMPLTQAGLAPTFEQLELFDRASQHSLPYSELLRAFEDRAKTDKRYFCCALEASVRLAELIDEADGLTLTQRHTLCNAPLDARDSLHASGLQQWARDISRGTIARLRFAPPARVPETHVELKALEAYFRLLDGYLWLSMRFPEAFAHAEKASRYRETCAALIDDAIEDLPALTPLERNRFQQLRQQSKKGGGGGGGGGDGGRNLARSKGGGRR